MRPIIIAAAALALSGCTEKAVQNTSRTIADELIEVGQRQMQPVHDELQKGLKEWGDEQQQRMKEMRTGTRQGAPIRECVIDGVKTFDNRGNLCQPNDR